MSKWVRWDGSIQSSPSTLAAPHADPVTIIRSDNVVKVLNGPARVGSLGITSSNLQLSAHGALLGGVGRILGAIAGGGVLSLPSFTREAVMSCAMASPINVPQLNATLTGLGERMPDYLSLKSSLDMLDHAARGFCRMRQDVQGS